MVEKEIRANLQTAQNQMFPFVNASLDRFEQEAQISMYLKNPTRLKNLFSRVRQQLLTLLHIPEEKRDLWHMGIADSGKRTIEILVHFLCPAHPGKNAIVDTENYVGFNKFSAAKALEKQKHTAFEKPFNIELGRALTVNSEKEFNKLTQMFEENRFDTLWLSWNSTSTGVKERIEHIVKCRNAAQSKTIIIADAASLRLFSNEWELTQADTLPDVFFFSLRKQGLPYQGPNDEYHQAQNSGSVILFNDNARKWADKINTGTLYDSPTLSEYAAGRVTRGDQRPNHIRHLLKLNTACDYFLDPDRKHLAALDAACQSAHSKITDAFACQKEDPLSRFSLFSDPEAQSDSAYILRVPERFSAKKIISDLKDCGILVSGCMHPEMDSQKYIRFAFYPGNNTDEVDYLIHRIKGL